MSYRHVRHWLFWEVCVLLSGNLVFCAACSSKNDPGPSVDRDSSGGDSSASRGGANAGVGGRGGSAESGGSSSDGEPGAGGENGSTGGAGTGGTTNQGDGAVRVSQMTSCEGETSGLSAEKIYYVTPEGSGDGASFATGMNWEEALAVVSAGEMVLLQPGTYTIPVVNSSQRNTIQLLQSGQANALIYLVAANCGRAKFDFSYPANEWQAGDGKSFGFYLKGNYWYLKNLDVTGAGYHGIWIGGTTADPTGGTHNTIENCSFYNNRNSGLEINSGGAHNTIINVDSYDNYDLKLREDGTMGGMADGFASKQTQGAGNQFFGCRAWGNSDDGFDTFGNTDPVNIEYSWAFSNGIDIWGADFWRGLGASFKGNGNGFKLGGDGVKQSNRVIHSVAFSNPQNGFDLNSNVGGQILYNNLGYKNGRNYDFDSVLESGEEHVFRNNISLGGQNSDTFQRTNSSHNTWDALEVNYVDFQSLDVAQAKVARNADGSLPHSELFRLRSSSGLIDSGTDVELSFEGKAPDLGPFESPP